MITSPTKDRAAGSYRQSRSREEVILDGSCREDERKNREARSY